jgi:hypothetical protein
LLDGICTVDGFRRNFLADRTRIMPEDYHARQRSLIPVFTCSI